ncbi:PREDICTED: uncharacterized protein LOC109580351 [Amphimedon queenslandica]|nr:PREDICTED: uncharacterized protein LOC109580351 [Amphimedon queenslandica]|eukprot:XP_019848946.1 PREDICTED: uncharacterized protein LOC109580351 [Amphimedon queenslandica]
MESSLNDCDKVLYPLNIAKQLANTTDEIAAVACIVETRSTASTVKQVSKSTQSNVQPTMDSDQNKPNFRNDPYFISLCVLAGVLLIVVCAILGSKVRNSRRKKRLASLSLQTTQSEPKSSDDSDDSDEPEIQEHHCRYYQRHCQYHSSHHQHSQNDFPVASQKEAYSIKRTLVLQEERVHVVQKVIN